MKAMLSQPMAGKTEEEIIATRERAIKALEAQGYEVVNTLFTDDWYKPENMKERGVENIPLCFLAKSLENMSMCNAAYFCTGWENARGCQIEHAAAKKYGMKIIYEDATETSTHTETKIYIGVKRLIATPHERDGLPGYDVVYEDGYESWSPKDVFERAYLPITRPDKLTIDDINEFMGRGEAFTEKRGEKTTLVEFVMPTGWIDFEVSSCVDPVNYDQDLGEKICLDRITNRLWSHLGFVLQWADKGLQPHNTGK